MVRFGGLKFFLLLMAVIYSERLLSQGDDFSLGGDVDLDSDDGNGDSLDGVDKGTDLFGDSFSNPVPSDTKSTIVKSPKPTASLPPPKPQTAPSLVPSSPGSLSPVNSTLAPKAQSAAPTTPPSNILTPASASSPLPASSSPGAVLGQSAPSSPAPVKSAEPEQPAGLTEAPLLGDGSSAPVKSNQTIVPNEFGGVPPLPGTKRAMAPGEAPEIYEVEQGDTMFDVCSQLIDDGNYWPKLWSLNPDVKNPHFIYPRMKLAFYSGDQDTPPYLEVVTDDEVLPIEKGSISEAELVSDTLPTGGKEGGSEKAVTFTEAEVPIAVIGPSEIGADSDGLDGFIFAGRSYASSTREFMVPAFFVADEKNPLCEVISGINGEGITGDGQKILLTPNESLGLGTYSVLRPFGGVSSLKTGDAVGYRYDFSGNVRITRQTKNGLLEGVVFGVRGGIRSGDIVVNFISTRRSIPDVVAIGSLGSSSSSVIGFDDAGKKAGGLGDFVFLEKTGLSAGSHYGIFRSEEYLDLHHMRNDEAKSHGTLTAVVRVIEIYGESALGQIVSGSGEVRVGDSLSL